MIGTFTDSNELRAAAQAFSAEEDITSSTKWANLLGEDGGVAGEGWRPYTDHSDRIAALDAAVGRRLQERGEGTAHATPRTPHTPASPASSSSRSPIVWLLVVAAAVGAIWFFNSASRQPSPGQQPQAESCGDWLSAAIKVTRADNWVEPTASEFLDAFSTRCNSEYWIWLDWRDIRNDAARYGAEKCQYWTQFKVRPEAIELARQDGSCKK